MRRWSSRKSRKRIDRHGATVYERPGGNPDDSFRGGYQRGVPAMEIGEVLPLGKPLIQVV